MTSTPASTSADYVQLVPAEHFTSFGFWKPGMQSVHAKVWDTLREMGLRFWSDTSREIRVHPQDFEKARAVLLCTERTMKIS